MTPKTEGPCLKCGFWNCEGGEKCSGGLEQAYPKTMAHLKKISEELNERANALCESVGTSAQVVAHPAHYTTGKIEVIDFILDQKLGYCLGNAIKYICRCNHKGDKRTDLEKAIQYLKFELEKM